MGAGGYFNGTSKLFFYFESFLYWIPSGANILSVICSLGAIDLGLKVAKAETNFIIWEPATEYIGDNSENSAQDNLELISKGTISWIFNEDLKESYLVMDSCTVHISKQIMRKIESCG